MPTTKINITLMEETEAEISRRAEQSGGNRSRQINDDLSEYYELQRQAERRVSRQFKPDELSTIRQALSSVLITVTSYQSLEDEMEEVGADTLCKVQALGLMERQALVRVARR